jgi:CRP-like cAMP-binding protein
MSDDELARVARYLTHHRLPAECMVMEQGTPGESMFLLLSGRVRVSIENADCRELTLRYINAPSYFGELAAIDEGTRSETITTFGPVEILELRAKDMDALLAANPLFARELLVRMAHSARSTLSRLGESVFMNSQQRVLSVMLWLTGEWNLRVGADGRQAPSRRGGWQVMEAHTHAQIANMSRTSRETVTRTFGILRQMGALRTTPAGVELNTEILRELLIEDEF